MINTLLQFRGQNSSMKRHISDADDSTNGANAKRQMVGLSRRIKTVMGDRVKSLDSGYGDDSLSRTSSLATVSSGGGSMSEQSSAVVLVNGSEVIVQDNISNEEDNTND